MVRDKIRKPYTDLFCLVPGTIPERKVPQSFRGTRDLEEQRTDLSEGGTRDQPDQSEKKVVWGRIDGGEVVGSQSRRKNVHLNGFWEITKGTDSNSLVGEQCETPGGIDRDE